MTPKDGCVWITGASSGIGREVAGQMCKAGWTVCATARRGEELESLANELSGTLGALRAYPADISDHTDVEETVRRILAEVGPIAIGILNAGVYLPVKTTELANELTAFQRSVDVNLMGTVHCIAPLIAHMTTTGHGQIALVSSVTGYGGLPTCAAYGATKAALINLAECMSIELLPKGIQTTLINPGFVDTPAQDDLGFPKPFMISSPEAATRIRRGLQSGKFEVTFPRRFTWPLKALSCLIPKALYLWLVRRQTL